MLTHARARSIAKSCSGFVDMKSTRSTRPGTFAFDVVEGVSAVMVIDVRALTREEDVEMQKVFRPLKATEVINASTGEVVSFTSPYNTRRPRIPNGPDGRSIQTRSQLVPIYHLHGMWDWTMPAVYFDIRPKCVSRERALDLYCKHFSQSRHDHIQAHKIVAQAST